MIFKRWRSQGGSHDLVWRAVKRFFSRGIKSLQQKWAKCIELLWDYIEKLKNIFFVISCFFLTQVDKLLNTPRISEWRFCNKEQM